MIIIKYGISLEDFLFLNKAVNVNCTNLLADESYCVQPVGDSKSTPIVRSLVYKLTLQSIHTVVAPDISPLTRLL